VHRRIMFLFAVVLACCLTTGISADEIESAIIVQATRHDASGAVVPVPSTVDASGSVLPGLAIPGEYILISGAEMPSQAAIQAFLVTPAQTFTLVYHDLSAPGTTTPPALTTDRFGTFTGAAFLLPPVDAIHTRNAQVIVLVAEDDGDFIPATTSIVFDLP
jgi:hypothetical protein